MAVIFTIGEVALLRQLVQGLCQEHSADGVACWGQPRSTLLTDQTVDYMHSICPCRNAGINLVWGLASGLCLLTQIFVIYSLII